MPWLQLHIATKPEEAPLLETKLSKLGAQAITYVDAANQPLYGPEPGTTPLWQQLWITGLFPTECDMQRLITQLEQSFGPNLMWHSATLADQDWAHSWQAHFQPMRFGQRLWICQAESEIPPDPNIIPVILEPGLAFGTGAHPTTALCLRWLDKNITPTTPLIDYGCGSGILAISALKLGAPLAYAIDTDPQALQATQANAKRNQIDSDTLSLSLPKTFSPAIKTPILIANILANPLIELAPLLATHLHPNGQIVLSGILSNQIERVQHAYAPWFKFQNPIMDEGWALLVGHLLYHPTTML